MWEIYYDDESVINESDSSWYDCKSNGVLIIVEYLPNKKRITHMGMDYYLMKDNNIISFSLINLHNYLIGGIDKNAIKFGITVPNDVWNKVYKKVFN